MLYNCPAVTCSFPEPPSSSGSPLVVVPENSPPSMVLPTGCACLPMGARRRGNHPAGGLMKKLFAFVALFAALILPQTGPRMQTASSLDLRLGDFRASARPSGDRRSQ